jgi:SAP domain-containing ribonucleoprotein
LRSIEAKCESSSRQNQLQKKISYTTALRNRRALPLTDERSPMASQDSKPAQSAAAAEPTSPATAAAGEAPQSTTAAPNPSAAAAAAGGAATDLEKKMRRAERFGTQVVMSEDEKRSSRAER